MNIINYLFKHESLLVLCLILLCIINIFINNKKETNILFINIVLLILYFTFSQRKDKLILFLAILNFSIYGVLIEKLIVNKTRALTYRNDKIPQWLVTIYAFFMIGSLYTYDFYKYLLK